jgi:hypothetical protein
MKEYLARIKPRDPTHGHVLRRYSYRGAKFEEGKGWYRVNKEVAEYLRSVPQQAHDPRSPLAFDVCTEAEAKAIDAKEAEANQPKRPVENARSVVTRDDKSEGSATPKRNRKPSGESNKEKEKTPTESPKEQDAKVDVNE